MRLMALLAYPLGMALGQVMFKLAAIQFAQSPQAHWLSAASDLLLNKWLIGALALYVVMTFLWVWILAEMPLSIAYPFAAFSFVLTPLLGHFVFSEALAWNHLVGLALVVAGILVIVN